MSIKPEISHRINLLRFPLILGVIFIHTQIKQYSSYPISDGFQNLVETISRVSVPLLFIISGYLFFINFEPTWPTYTKKIKGRFWTILIPYLFWNFTFLVFLWGLQLIPSMSSFFIRGYQRFVLTDNTNYVNYFLDAFLGTNKDYPYPVSGHLWYLLDLFFLSILAPLFWFLGKRVPYLGLIVLTLNFILTSLIYPHPKGFYFSSIFFYFGGMLAIQNIDILIVDRYKKLIIPIYLVMTLIVVNIHTIDPVINVIIKQLNLFLGILAVWCSSSLFGESLQRILLKLSPFAIFIFLAQQPFIMAAKFLLVNRFLPRSNSLLVLINYFFITFFVIIGTITLSLMVKKYTPKFYSLITGNRG